MLQGDIWDYAVAALFGACGGIARALDVRDKKELSIFRLMSGVFISGFVGILFYMILRETDMSSGLVGAIVGIAGYAGPKAIKWITKLLGKKTGVDLADDEGDEK